MATPFIKPRVPRGMRDILPEQMIRRQYVIDVIREVFEAFGFEPLQTPALELSEVLTGKYGPDAEKLIYQAGHVGGKEDISPPLRSFSTALSAYCDVPAAAETV